MSTWYIQNGVLCHHGIKGQKWGVRNAEWYPIAAWKESVGGAITKYKNKKKMAKVRSAKEEKAKAQAEREKILNTATPNQLVKLNKKYQFTSEEIKKVQDRFANEKALKDLANTTARNRVKEFSDKIGPIVDAMKLFNSVVSTTVAAKNNIDKIRGLLKDQEDSDDKKDDKEDSASSKSSDTPKSSAKNSKGSKWETRDKTSSPVNDAIGDAVKEAAKAAASKVAEEIIQPDFEEKYLKISAQDMLLLEDKRK